MTLGQKITLLRRQNNLTQEKLAAMLNVSRQTIYKWEADVAFPEKDKLDLLVKIFNVSFDTLLNDNKKIETNGEPLVKEEKKEEPPVVKEAIKPQIIPVTKVVEKETLVLGVCDDCHKKIVDQDDYHVDKHRHSRSILCSDCYQKKQERKKEQKMAEYKKKCSRGIGWGIFSCIFLIFVTILLGVNYQGAYRLEILLSFGISCALIPMAVFTIFLDNTFLSEIFMSIASFGFVKMPGIIFSFDLDGLAFLLVMKIILGIFGFLIVIAALILALAICAIFSPIAFPLSISRYKNGTHMPI